MTADVPPSPRAARAGWLFGPFPDLLIGGGGLYLVLWLVMSGGLWSPTGDEHRDLRPILILLVSIPHYGATLIRVYGQKADRRRYQVFGLYGTLVVFGAMAWGLSDSVVGAWYLTLYLTWSPWHYTGQNYGLALTFLRRAGITVTPGLKRCIYASFILSYVLVVVMIHGVGGGPADYPNEERYATTLQFVALGLPAELTSVVVPLALLGILVCGGAAAFMLLRRATPRVLAPVLMIFLLQSVWFTLPFSLNHFGVATGLPFIDLATRDKLFTYIAISHAAQYLWVTSFFARKTVSWSGYASYWFKAMAFGQVVTKVPILLAAHVGGLAFDAGVAQLVIAAVNLHHFVLDGAIWKLRTGPIASVLLRDGGDTGPAPIGVPNPWRRRAAAIAITLLVSLGVATYWQRFFVYRGALDDRDPVRAARAADRLSWFGEESAIDRYTIAGYYVERGDEDAALQELQRSLELRPLPQTWLELGRLHERAGEIERALEAYEEGLVLAPVSQDLLRASGLAAAQVGNWELAVERLKSIVQNRPDDAEAARAYVEARRQKLDAEPEDPGAAARDPDGSAADDPHVAGS